MGKKRRLRRRMRERGLDGVVALVVCTGKDCAPREVTRPLVHELRGYAEERPPVQVVTVSCLGVCKRGPVAATFPRIRIKKRVDADRARRMIDKLERRARAARGPS